MTQSLSCSIEVNIVIMCLLFHPGIKEREREKKPSKPKTRCSCACSLSGHSCMDSAACSLLSLKGR